MRRGGAIPAGEYEVAADVPGRLRVRLGRAPETAGALARIQATLQAIPGVYGVRIAPATCSVVVAYDRHSADAHDFLKALDELGHARREPGSATSGGGPRAIAGTLAVAGTRAVAGTVASSSRQVLDSESAAPMFLGLLSARQLVRYGPQLHKAPWYTFAWYAYSLYASRRSTDGAASGGGRTP